MDAKLYITEIINELTFVKDSIREDDCTKLIDAIQQSQRVFCYGLGRAGFSMKAFTMRLMHMGKEVYFLTETITPNFGPGDLFIVSSASGETAQLVALAKKSTSVWRRCGGVNHESTRHYHRVCRRHRANQCPFQKSKRFCFPLGTTDGVVV